MPSFVRKRSYGSVKVYWLDKEGLISALEKKAQDALERFPELRKVVLFGSLARGEATPRSDADLLFVVEEAGPFLERPARYLPFFRRLGFSGGLAGLCRARARAHPLGQAGLKRGARASRTVQPRM